MIRWLSVFLLLATPAVAQTQAQCPGSNASWSFTLPAPMQWAFYDLIPPPGVAVGLVSVVYTNRTAETFLGVPQTVPQKWQVSSNPTQFFNVQIKPVYHELLLNPGSNCPLLNPGGNALWTK